jgi:uncharacterized membrane protein
VPFLDPLNPSAPALAVAKVLPLLSVTVIIVLLKVAKTWIWPCETARLDFLRFLLALQQQPQSAAACVCSASDTGVVVCTSSAINLYLKS